MRRTQIILVVLALFAATLAGLKLVKRPADVIGPAPTPTIIFPTLTPISPTPTSFPIDPINHFTDTHLIFKLDYPENWAISNQASASAQETWQLKFQTASASAKFQFSLYPATTLPSLVCPTSVPNCQVVEINQAAYQVNLNQISLNSLDIAYKSVHDPYVLTIKGTITGTGAELNQIVTDWDDITQSFKWQ